ncbi:uncharacterized protein VDAG_08151 [Verticillium dahliae VdLs.17]|uniref:DUF7730 domain-containing protein n=1 Tax=Verticillium dahliae (strain VdLs.17 / ATCC MYA-4575 / FGSC 10137) TaxID=498257 RepID=G2XDB9_VERDV|nr:uncharacterized protein VDAG_08151 [Verticillium dahliae VdLs.17]EGY16987.1 hypothetical protein VDAG_08151 [Verticillium dahliae VdLs.17]
MKLTFGGRGENSSLKIDPQCPGKAYAMGFAYLRSHLMARKGTGSPARYPDYHAIASTMRPQPKTATLMQLPLEIRIAILEELWKDAGFAQHIIHCKGRYVRARCVTDHAAPDELMEECAKRRASRFEDKELWQRMQSSWGNHWRCEEEYGREATSSVALGDGKCWSNPFLAILLVCKQLYIEGRTSIFSFVNFVIHDINTLHSLTAVGAPPLLSSIRALSLSIRLPIRRESKMKMSSEAHGTMRRWRECCASLNQAAERKTLVSVELWLDTSEPTWRGVLSTVLDGPASPFTFGEHLARVLTVDLPVNPEKPAVWRRVAEIEPRFTVRPRGWPGFRVGDTTESSPHTIIRLWDSAEPGVEQPEPVYSVGFSHRRPWYLRGS